MFFQASISQLLQEIYARRVFVIGVTVLVTVLAGIRMLVFPGITYEAEVILAVTEPALAKDGLSELIPEPLHTKSYANLLESTTVIGTVHERLAGSGFWKDRGDPPPLDAFAGQLKLESVTVDQTTRPVNYSPFITLIAKASSVENAQQIASMWSDVSIEAARQANGIRVASTVDVLRQQESEHSARLKSALDKLSKEESEWNIELLEVQSKLQVEATEDLRSQLVSQQLNLAAYAAGLEAIRTELEGIEPTLKLFRAPSNDVFWLKQQQSPGSVDPESANEGMLDEVVNEVYIDLRTREIKLAEDHAHAKAAVESLKNDIQTQVQERASLQQNLALHKYIQLELKQELTIAEESFGEVGHLRAFAEAAAGLANVDPSASTTPIGLNRIGEKVYVREQQSLLAGKLSVILAAMSAFVLACGYVVAVRFGMPK